MYIKKYTKNIYRYVHVVRTHFVPTMLRLRHPPGITVLYSIFRPGYFYKSRENFHLPLDPEWGRFKIIQPRPFSISFGIPKIND